MNSFSLICVSPFAGTDHLEKAFLELSDTLAKSLVGAQISLGFFKYHILEKLQRNIFWASKKLGHRGKKALMFVSNLDLIVIGLNVLLLNI